jgi:hypothetical protein
MAVTVALAADPNLMGLRYLATHDGVADGNSFTIPNAAGATPDLKTDILAQAFFESAEGGVKNPSNLQRIIDINRNGFGVIVAGAMTQAEARAVMISEDPTFATLVSNIVPRARIVLTPRVNPAGLTWSVDVDVDGSFNPVIIVSTNTNAVAECYVDFMYRFTDEL